MKHIFLFLCTLLALVGCSSEDPITPGLTYGNDFVITDQPNDSIQHERYLLYKDFGVPVYFNDTIAKHNQGLGVDGKPRTTYETVDLNWTFSGYNRGVKYSYVYLTAPEDQMRALRFIRSYLGHISKPMRPFSIMVADTLTATSTHRTQQPTFHVGFRTLVLAQVRSLTDSAKVATQINTIVQSMVSDRVKAQTALCGRFAEVSKTNGWYGQEWKKLNNVHSMPTVVDLGKKSFVYSVNALFDEPPFTPYNHEDIVTLLLRSTGGQDPIAKDEEEAQNMRKAMIAEIAQFGFLTGWKQSGAYAPSDDSEDREQYLQALLYLGDGGFRQRYGDFPLVMQKYELLYNFITQSLGLNLNYSRIEQ